MVFTMLLGMVVDYDNGGFGRGLDESPAHQTLLWHLNYISEVLGVLGPLTIFTTTFFLNQAFHFWSRFYCKLYGISIIV